MTLVLVRVDFDLSFFKILPVVCVINFLAEFATSIVMLQKANQTFSFVIVVVGEVVIRGSSLSCKNI